MASGPNFYDVTASGPTTFASPPPANLNATLSLAAWKVTGDPLTNLSFYFSDSLNNRISSVNYLPAGGAVNGIAFTDVTMYRGAQGASLIINLSAAPSVSVGLEFALVTK
jgi:hypothetical protein